MLEDNRSVEELSHREEEVSEDDSEGSEGEGRKESERESVWGDERTPLVLTIKVINNQNVAKNEKKINDYISSKLTFTLECPELAFAYDNDDVHVYNENKDCDGNNNGSKNKNKNENKSDDDDRSHNGGGGNVKKRGSTAEDRDDYFSSILMTCTGVDMCVLHIYIFIYIYLHI
jgi:hypothetical protein